MMFENMFLVIEATKLFLADKGWYGKQCTHCGRSIFGKKLNTLEQCPICYKQTPSVEDRMKVILREDIVKLSNIITDYLQKKGISRQGALPIWKSPAGNIFVGSGLEYIFLPQSKVHLPAVIFQPSIRLREGVQGLVHQMINKNSFLSFAFTNISILRHTEEDLDSMVNAYTASLDFAVSLLSYLGIHATRLAFLLDPTPHRIDSQSASVVTRIVLDGIEVGDHVLLKRESSKDIYIETGFGFERLVSRLFATNYWSTFFSPYCNDNILLLKVVHVLSLFTMSSVPYARSEAWSKARTIASLIREEVGRFDSFLLFSDMYSIWRTFIGSEEERMPLFLAYLQFLSLIK